MALSGSVGKLIAMHSFDKLGFNTLSQLVAKQGSKDSASPQRRNSRSVQVLEKDAIAKPPIYAVIMINDDFTSMEFVISILISLYDKTLEQANTIMLQIHNSGQGTVGIYSYEVAETLVEETIAQARVHEFPLRCVIKQISDD